MSKKDKTLLEAVNNLAEKIDELVMSTKIYVILSWILSKIIEMNKQEEEKRMNNIFYKAVCVYILIHILVFGSLMLFVLLTQN